MDSPAPQIGETPRHGWLSLRVILAVLVALIGASFGRPYVELYLQLNLAYMNQLSFAALLYVGLLALIWNPLFGRISQNLVFKGPELFVICIASMLIIWSSGVYPGHMMIGPHYMESGQILWEKHDLLNNVPGHLIPLAGNTSSEYYEQVYVNYAQGLVPGETVPWEHWLGPLSNWMPLFIIFSVICISLAWIVHRQWSRNEQLTYPIAQISVSLFQREEQRRLPDIFYSKLMWIAAGTVLCIHLYNILNTWFPGTLPTLSFKARFNFLWNVFTSLNRTGSYWLVDFHLMFSVIGLAYFLGREVCLTLGLSQVILLFCAMQIYSNTGVVISSGNIEDSRSGAYLAYALIILITGRHYYLGLLKRAFGIKTDDNEHADPWVVRIFLAACFALYLYLIYIFQIDFIVALVYISLLILAVIAFSRLVCEVGGPYIQGQWALGKCMLTFMGPAAIGPAALVSILYVSSALSVTGNAALMPLVSNGLQIGEKANLKRRFLFPSLIIVAILGIILTAVWRTEYYYEYGAQSKQANGQSFGKGSTGLLGHAQRSMEHLDEFGQIEESKNASGFDKLGLLSPDWSSVSWMSIGALGVALFFFLRVRCNWFPLHPILFLVWNTFPIQIFYWSFFIGWCCKELVIRFGGGNIFQRAKPFFIGLIVGDLLAFAVNAFLVVSYAVSTGADPKVYRVFIFF